MTRAEHPDARWYKSAYRQGWLAFCNGEPMPRAEHALNDAGLRDGWEAARAKYEHDAIAVEYRPPEEAT